jgi:hypothetical protein
MIRYSEHAGLATIGLLLTSQPHAPCMVLGHVKDTVIQQI